MGRRTAEPPISWLMRIKLERPRLISLAAGFTDNPTLPVAGSRRLLELADSIEEIKTTCACCNRKAVFNLKSVDGKPTLYICHEGICEAPEVLSE